MVKALSATAIALLIHGLISSEIVAARQTQDQGQNGADSETDVSRGIECLAKLGKDGIDGIRGTDCEEILGLDPASIEKKLEEEADEMLAFAIYWYTERDYESAVSILENFIAQKSVPNSRVGSIYNLLALNYEKLGRLEDAIGALSTWSASEPDNPEAIETVANLVWRYWLSTNQFKLATDVTVANLQRSLDAREPGAQSEIGEDALQNEAEPDNCWRGGPSTTVIAEDPDGHVSSRTALTNRCVRPIVVTACYSGGDPSERRFGTIGAGQTVSLKLSGLPALKTTTSDNNFVAPSPVIRACYKPQNCVLSTC